MAVLDDFECSLFALVSKREWNTEFTCSFKYVVGIEHVGIHILMFSRTKNGHCCTITHSTWISCVTLALIRSFHAIRLRTVRVIAVVVVISPMFVHFGSFIILYRILSPRIQTVNGLHKYVSISFLCSCLRSLPLNIILSSVFEFSELNKTKTEWRKNRNTPQPDPVTCQEYYEIFRWSFGQRPLTERYSVSFLVELMNDEKWRNFVHDNLNIKI